MAGGQLQRAVENALVEYFAAHKGAQPPSGLYQRVMQEVESPLIRQTLQYTCGNQCKAAEILGINRNTLRKKIQQLGLSTMDAAS